MTNLYDTLGVAPDATDADIKRAYRKAAKTHHPDKGGDPEKFAQAGQAWIVLKDPERRAKYDRDGTTDAPIDDSLAQVGNMLCSLFAGVMDSPTASVDYSDLVAEVRRSLDDMRRKSVASVAQIEKAHAKTEKAIKRLKYSGERGDLIGVMLNGMLSRFADEKRKFIKEQETIDAAKAYLLDYRYDAEKQSGYSRSSPSLSDLMSNPWR